uniref:AlNc14C67G4738 protein n=1 Tax=Albugo laibachii Nc14 TaxID=890382 RepID=F0WDL8_9STRA|nr:AlNc14C67G4738 [Albugo laibachii Nc14]|eukprot:CCA19293.1 AlNc14C67G4738 [Albugo laibachii Nc14]
MNDKGFTTVALRSVVNESDFGRGDIGGTEFGNAWFGLWHVIAFEISLREEAFRNFKDFDELSFADLEGTNLSHSLTESVPLCERLESPESEFALLNCGDATQIFGYSITHAEMVARRREMFMSDSLRIEK